MIDDYVIISTRSIVDETVMTVFREADKYIRVVRIDDDGTRHETGKSVPTDFEVDEEDEQIDIGYAAPGWAVKDRLDVMGFTLDATRDVYQRGIKARLERIRNWLTEFPDSVHWLQDIEFLQQLSFEKWLTEFAELKRRRAYGYNTDPLHTPAKDHISVSPIGAYLLGGESEYLFRFPSVDPRFFLRAVIEACGDNTVLSQDLNEVVSAGHYRYSDLVASTASTNAAEDLLANTRVIILTEGVTDRRALEGALGVLYPHLSESFAFMDFEGAAVAGGAGPLVATVKAFAGAGIANRVIALFDNDTAARAAVRGLSRIKLPASMVIAHYPPLDFAKNYPTLGPSGAATMDVNGLAGSVELYFGEDVLRQESGLFVPVVWRSFDDATSSYQGELSSKAVLQARFSQKVAAASADPSLIKTLDWSGMKLIISRLVGAFSNRPTHISDD
ncbi:hypothetical protein K8640_36470 [Myxococcus sp. XM-1-1-1]|nr:hypothetical protein [Myxococcus sp. XM-1-1-1]